MVAVQSVVISSGSASRFRRPATCVRTASSSSGATFDTGISNLNVAGSGAVITQTLNLDNNTVTWIGGNQASSGIGAFAGAATGISNVNLTLGNGSTISQGLHIDRNTVANVYAFFVANGIGNVNVAAGAVMNYAGNLGGSLASAGIATSAGTIAGTLTLPEPRKAAACRLTIHTGIAPANR